MTKNKPNHLKIAIFEYISNNNGMLDSVDITSHFKTYVHVVLNEVKNLENEGKIKRIWDIKGFRYKVINQNTHLTSSTRSVCPPFLQTPIPHKSP